jgi:hypothetical protein
MATKIPFGESKYNKTKNLTSPQALLPFLLIQFAALTFYL